MCSSGSWHVDPYHPPPAQRTRRAAPSASSFHRIAAVVDGGRLRPKRTRPERGRRTIGHRPPPQRKPCHDLVRIEGRRGRTSCPANTSAGSCWCGRGATRPSARQDLGLRPGQVWVSDGCSATFATGAGVDTGPTKQKARFTFRTSASCSSTPTRGRSTSAFSATGVTSISGTSTRRTSTRSAIRRPCSAPGRPAAEVLRAVLGMVPHAEDALLPLRLVVERLAGRSGAGRGRGQPDWASTGTSSVGVGITSLPSVRSTEGSSRTGSASTTA
jgi:hypothetical protein